ncbi:MAG: hypothetical protein R6W81_11145 [Bacteroidales bacterium]
MKKYVILVLFCSAVLVTAFLPEGNPSAEISNGLIKASLYLPDAQNGYYRGTRFDWSGQISGLTFDGHTYFGKWFDKYDPVLHDAIMGPVEEFGPLGYGEADAGGEFIMIGIGALKKPVEKSHNRFGYYEISNHGKWKVKRKKDQVQFIHRLEHGGYSYEYTKVVRLVKGKPEMEILHTLKNKGKMPVRTNVYNHNFFVINGQPTGPGFTVKFPYNISGEGQGFGTVALIKDNTIGFSRNLNKGETVFCGALKGYRDVPEDYDVRIENSTTGAGVRIRGDKPLSRLVFWAASTTLCPETYIDIDIDPGKDFGWKIGYEFYSLD